MLRSSRDSLYVKQNRTSAHSSLWLNMYWAFFPVLNSEKAVHFRKMIENRSKLLHKVCRLPQPHPHTFRRGCFLGYLLMESGGRQTESMQCDRGEHSQCSGGCLYCHLRFPPPPEEHLCNGLRIDICSLNSVVFWCATNHQWKLGSFKRIIRIRPSNTVQHFLYKPGKLGVIPQNLHKGRRRPSKLSSGLHLSPITCAHARRHTRTYTPTTAIIVVIIVLVIIAIIYFNS